MHYLNEYHKSYTYESVTLKEKRLTFLKHSLCAPQLCAEFLERIVRTIRGFTVPCNSRIVNSAISVRYYGVEVDANEVDAMQCCRQQSPPADVEHACNVCLASLHLHKIKEVR